MRHIIFVDGSVGVGKSTFINVLANVFESTLKIKNEGNVNKSHGFNVEVLPEPLHRNWTRQIIDKLGDYNKLLQFLLVRKIVAIEAWSQKIASDGLQELEDNVLIVERSLEGDRRVAADHEDFDESLLVHYTGECVRHVFIQSQAANFIENDEQIRLNLLYNEKEICEGHRTIHRIMRPNFISGYFAEAAQIVKSTLQA